MFGIVAGVVAGLAVHGGWFSLYMFCILAAISLGVWRIFSGYRRLKRGGNYPRKYSDARNMVLTSDVPDDELETLRIIATGDIQKPTFKMYMRACLWEFVMIATVASAIRLIKVVFF